MEREEKNEGLLLKEIGVPAGNSNSDKTGSSPAKEILIPITTQGVVSTDEDPHLGTARLFLIYSNIVFILSGILTKAFQAYFPDTPLLIYSSNRLLHTAIMSYLFIRYYKKESVVSVLTFGGSPIWLGIRVFIFVSATFFAMISFNNLKLGVAHLLNQLAPLFTNLISPCLIAEKLRLKYIIACIICILGVILIVFQEEHNDSDGDSMSSQEVSAGSGTVRAATVIGFAVGTLNAVILAVSNVSGKVLSKEFDALSLSYIVNFWATIVSFLTCALYYDLTEFLILFNVKFFFYTFLHSLFAMTGNVLIIWSFEMTDLSKVVYLFYLQVPITSILGMFIFGDHFGPIETLGGVIIFGTIIAVTYIK